MNIDRKPCISLYEALQSVILDSTEEEIDEIIRAQGANPEDVVKKGREAIQKALDRVRAEKLR